MRSKPVILLIFDGWGYRDNGPDNAIASAYTPTWDRLWSENPHCLIDGSGEAVGLPDGQMGNSEVGHITMGTGRVIYQDLTLISKSIVDHSFFTNPAFLKAFDQVRSAHSALHIMGLLSPGGVHSHEDHIFTLIEMAAKENAFPIYVHAFLDGRDTPPQSALASLEKLEAICNSYSNVKIASVIGRYYAMDRDNRWERVKEAFDAIAFGKAGYHASSATDALEKAYARGETDEFVKPTIITDNAVKPNDVVIYMNFRADRARALTKAFTDPTFTYFSKKGLPTLSSFVTLTEYDKTFPVVVAFPSQKHKNGMGEYLQNLHLSQLRIAETEKYAHVTFFFSGGQETAFEGEQRILVPSPKVKTYDLKPEMSAFELTEQLVNSIRGNQFDFIVCNFANADMVGHTGNFEATVKAIETLDECLLHIVTALRKVDGQMLVTSDHGNAECMFDRENNQPHTAHTTSLIPLLYIGKRPVAFDTVKGTLSDIAPTLLWLMGLDKPIEMTGHSLLVNNDR